MHPSVPPVIEPPRTVIGVGAREVLLLGAGLLAACLVILSPLSLIPRIGLAALLFGGTALLALGRAPASGKTAEAFLLDLVGFAGRGRLLQRNTGDPDPLPAEPSRPEPAPAARLRMPALPLDRSGFLGLFSLIFLLMLLAWIWTGALGELLLQLGFAR